MDVFMSLPQPIHELAVQANKNDLEGLIMALKVLGNAGHPSSLKPITKFLPGIGSAAADLPLRAHIEAVQAMRNIAKREPKMVRLHGHIPCITKDERIDSRTFYLQQIFVNQIQDMALQLFMDKALHSEVRMAAAIVLFETKLPMGLVITLANNLLTEKSLQVSSFVYSYMKSMTRNTSPDLASV